MTPARPAPAAPASPDAGEPAATQPAVLTEFSARHLGPLRRFFVRHPGAMDALVIAVFVLPALLTLLVGAPAPQGSSLTLEQAFAGVVLTLLGGVALIWRRRRPVAVATVLGGLTVVCLAVTGSLGGFDLGMALAVYAVAAARPPRTAWLALLSLGAATGLAVWLWQAPLALVSVTDGTDPWQLVVFVPEPDAAVAYDDRGMTAGTTLFILLVALAIGTSVRNRRQHVADLVERTNALARSRDQQAQLARAGERSRIAREMHDVVAHSLSVMVALADGAGVALDRAPDRARTAIDELSETGRSAMADMRRVLGMLHEDAAPLEPQPGSPDLNELVERFRTAGLPVSTEGLGAPLPSDAGLQLTVYRVVQEALTNVLRHAPGTREARLRLRVGPDRVEVEVHDRGPAVPSHGPTGLGRGLVGMRERAAVYGGTVEAGPSSEGWTVHVVLPWHEETS